MMTEVLYQFDDVEQTKEEPERSCKKDNQQQYMMSTLRRAYPMLRTNTDSNMAADQYNADPW